jgi:hypothetical protein
LPIPRALDAIASPRVVEAQAIEPVEKEVTQVSRAPEATAGPSIEDT